MARRGKCCCGCGYGAIESEPPDVSISGATPIGDWVNGPCCWEREFEATSPLQHVISSVRQISVRTEWIKTFYEYKRPWWAATWNATVFGVPDPMPTAGELEILACNRGYRALGEYGIEKELTHEERAVVSSRVKSMVLKYHKVDISETETPEIRHKFSLYVCYCVSVQFQAKTICYVHREWFSVEPGACFTGTEFDNSPVSETTINDTFNDAPTTLDPCTPNHCACFNRTFETLPSSITFNMTNSDEQIELYCGCNVGTDFCAEVPASFYYNSILSAVEDYLPTSSTNTIQSSGSRSLSLRLCEFPFTNMGSYSWTSTCPSLNLTIYNPISFNNAMPASCVRFQTGSQGVASNLHCTRTTTPTNCPPFDNAPFEDNLCPPEDPITFCPGGPALDSARWYADIYDNAISIDWSTDVPSVPDLICLNPVWVATLPLVEEEVPL